MRAVVRFVSCLITLLAVAPRSVSAQPQGPPELAIVAPAASSTRHHLNPKIAVEYWIGGQCLDDGSGDCDPDPATLLIRVNGVNRTSYFTVTEWNAQNGTGAVGNLNLTANAWNSIWARICNSFACADTSITVYIDPNPQTAVATGVRHPSVVDPGACAAIPAAPGLAFACDAVTYARGIPGYVSVGAQRAVALVYSSRSALGQLTVPANVSLVWDAFPTKVEAWLQGLSSTYWAGADWEGTSGTVSRRIVLVKPESTQTGGYVGRQLVTITARAHTAAGVYDATKVDTLPFYFERDSLTTPIARGWGIAGLARIYGSGGHAPGAGVPVGDVLLVQGGGGVAYYKYLSTAGDTASYGRPSGMFAMLKRSVSTGRWVLMAMDGTRQFYSWVEALGYARLDSVVSVVGRTSVAYRSAGSGAPATIADPMGHQIRFDYHAGSGVGKLYRICAPAGANERCTTITYGSSGGNTVVAAIVDPDGRQDTLGYAGGPHWAALTALTPRGLGSYTVTYHGALARPSGLVQPASSDTVRYLAPQLAGAALVGGTSANPAPSARADSAWGFVRLPLGQTSYFVADWLGNLTWAKGPDGKVSAVLRNGGGQPTATWRDGQWVGHRTYNAVGALTTVRAEGGDTNRITYAGACEAGTGYPCHPIRLVVSRAPWAPDTTRWFYDSTRAGVVDSVYRSGFGTTRYWHDAMARLDSVADPTGHVRGYRHEGTWGNLQYLIGDKVGGLCPPFPCVIGVDTTAYTYDGTGVVATMRRVPAGRKLSWRRDLIGRDTMLVDSAGAGGGVITTKTRFDDVARTVTVVDGRGQTVTFLADARGRRIRRTDAAGARDTLAYDANDRLVSRTTRRNQTITYAYDALSRLRTKVVPNDGTWTLGYHATYGTLDTLLTPSAAVYRTHDARGRLTQERTVVNGVSRTVGYSYTEAGALTSLTDPWGGSYTFGWDAANRARTIANPFSESFSVRYSTDGLVTKILFPTLADSVTYNKDHQVTAAGLAAEVTYLRDGVTRGIAQAAFGGVTQRYGYDGFGRLALDSLSTTGYGPVTEAFTYDAAGNRTGSPGTYTYTATNAARGRPAIAGDGFAPGDSLVYDAAGNPVWWKNKTTAGYDSLAWDAENRLIRVRRYTASHQLQLDANYAYDGFGRRVKKWGSGTGLVPRLYVWSGWELLGETDLNGAVARRYTQHPEGLDFPLAMREGSTSSYFHLDGQGNVYLLTDTGGTRRSEYRYRGYGDRYVTPVGEAVASPFGYKGREEDRETGLIYLRHRYYSPQLERFVNQDPIGTGGGLNAYQFVAGDPVNLGDPLGLCPWCVPIIIPGITVPVRGPDQPPIVGAEWFFFRMPGMAGGGGLLGGPVGGGGWGTRGGELPSEALAPAGTSGGTGRTDATGTTEQGAEDDDPTRSSCEISTVGVGLALALDFALIGAYAWGAGALVNAGLLLAEGWAMSSGLILTATVEGSGATGAVLMAGGRALVPTAARHSIGLWTITAGSIPDGLSFFPGVNTYNALHPCR